MRLKAKFKARDLSVSFNTRDINYEVQGSDLDYELDLDVVVETNPDGTFTVTNSQVFSDGDGFDLASVIPVTFIGC